MCVSCIIYVQCGQVCKSFHGCAMPTIYVFWCSRPFNLIINFTWSSSIATLRKRSTYFNWALCTSWCRYACVWKLKTNWQQNLCNFIPSLTFHIFAVFGVHEEQKLLHVFWIKPIDFVLISRICMRPSLKYTLVSAYWFALIYFCANTEKKLSAPSPLLCIATVGKRKRSVATKVLSIVQVISLSQLAALIYLFQFPTNFTFTIHLDCQLIFLCTQ